MLRDLLTRLRGRLIGDERGMTLVELMVGMTGALLVGAAGFAVVSFASNINTRTTYRLEATNRGREGMERITRDIRAQQCLDSGTPAMQWASDTGMQFYASVAEYNPGKPQKVERRRLEWIQRTDSEFKDNGPATGDIIETVWRSTSDGPPYSFPSTPTAKTVVAESVQRVGSEAIFRYFGYAPGTVGRPSATPFPLAASANSTLNPNGRPSVSDLNLPRIVLVEIRFESRPKRAQIAKSATVPFFNRVSVRTADPTDPNRSPLCL